MRRLSGTAKSYGTKQPHPIESREISGPDIFLGKTYAKVLGSFFVGFMVNKRRVLFTARTQPGERLIIEEHLWSL